MPGHQLPAVPPAAEPAPSALLELLAGRPVSLAPVCACSVDILDAALDERQRLAVARAVASPDVALVAGHPGCGKSRVVAEIVRQQLRRGLRVLLLASAGEALDGVLERLAAGGERGWLRVVASDETPADLPPVVHPHTLTERVRTYRDETLPAARRAVDQLAAALTARRARLDDWAALETLAAECEQIRATIAALEAERAGLETTLRAGAQADDEAAAAAVARFAEQAADLRRQRDAVAAEQTQLSDEQQHLRPLIEAKQGHRWWTGAWWKATIQGNPQCRLTEIAGRLQAFDERLHELDRQIAEAEEQRHQAEADHQAEQGRRFADELQRRSADLVTRLDAERGRHAERIARWQAATADLLADVPEPTAAALAAAQTRLAEQLTRDEADLAARRGWLDAVEAAAPGWADELVRDARLVAAPLRAVVTDHTVRETDLAGFDLLVVDDAHRLTEADWAPLARHGRRWLLVGELPLDLPLPPRRDGNHERTTSRQPFHRLWTHLHLDPRRLPARWRKGQGRLIASLRPLADDDRRWLTREPLFDRPEIEVTILAAPGREPAVVEVQFPEATPIGEAKEFIYRELHELPIQANSPMPAWREAAGAITLELSTQAAEGSAPGCDLSRASVVVALEAGVREHVGHCTCEAAFERPWPTVALEFARGDGWDRGGAERWVQDHLGWRDSGRTAVLDHCHRAVPELARWLAKLLHTGVCVPDTAPAPEYSLAAPVRFVPVPAAAARSEARRTSEPEGRWTGGGTATLAARPRPARGGAGLEVDLADPRRAETLPADLRAALPAHGVINYEEARAAIAAAEALANDLEFVAAALAWQQTHAAPALAVLSLFPAQVELMRLLAGRSPVLSAGPVRLTVSHPSRLADRGCLAAVVSLTRSHASRAVPFSEAPEDLVAALTRATAGLVLIGDPGTLARRSGWFGGLDHLDDCRGPLEQAVVAALVHQFCDPETSVRPPRGRESSGV
ncbi:MAG: AAA domain-containing protein [Gemmataceae bacterium]